MSKTTRCMRIATVWVQCLKMWKAVIYGTDKTEWCDAHNYSDLFLSCFFCDYAVRRQEKLVDISSFTYGLRYTCKFCPAKTVDPKFLCQNRKYHWAKHPDKFYTKLQDMNTKRLESNRKNRSRRIK